MTKRGRKPLPPEVREANRRTSKAKFKNISLDADLVVALNAHADRMAEAFGFRPTLSQIVRYLINKDKR